MDTRYNISPLHGTRKMIVNKVSQIVIHESNVGVH